jgi:hypothetical protein
MTLNTTNLGALSPLPEGGKSLRIPFGLSLNGGEEACACFDKTQPCVYS